MDKAKDVSIKRMVNSKDRTNQRFINMLRMQHAQRYGVNIGFKGFNKNKHKPNTVENQSEAEFKGRD